LEKKKEELQSSLPTATVKTEDGTELGDEEDDTDDDDEYLDWRSKSTRN
jgi:hypothetical protein